MKKVKGSKGITLVALVITVIVLLILAGVTIATLTGNNGILTRASEAKNESEESAIREKIKLCALSSRINTSGDISYTTLIEELDRTFGQNKYSINPQNANTSEWTVTVNNVSELIIGRQPTLANVITSENYGDSVNYSANGINDWKIFYNDGNNIFLITSDYLNNTKIPNIGISVEGINKVFWTEKDLIYKGSEDINKNIAKKYMLSCLDTCKKNNINMRIVAGLLDTNKWEDFVDKNVAETAIGSPTLEMFCASWNQKGYVKLYCDNFDNKGYYIGGNSKPTSFKYEILNNVGYNDTLYYPYKAATEDGCFGYILSSPSASDNAHIMRISSAGNVNYRWWSAPADGLRPIVCLKSTVIGAKNVDTGIWNIE